MKKIHIRRSRPSSLSAKRYPLPAGFTILELLLALVVVSGCLVSIVASLATLSRHLSRTEIEIQALAFANTKIMEWEHLLRAGTKPVYFSGTGTFPEAPEFGWRSESTSIKLETTAGAASSSVYPPESLYQLNLEILHKNRPVLSVGAEGWLREPLSEFGTP